MKRFSTYTEGFEGWHKGWINVKTKKVFVWEDPIVHHLMYVWRNGKSFFKDKKNEMAFYSYVIDKNTLWSEEAFKILFDEGWVRVGLQSSVMYFHGNRIDLRIAGKLYYELVDYKDPSWIDKVKIINFELPGDSLPFKKVNTDRTLDLYWKGKISI